MSPENIADFTSALGDGRPVKRARASCPPISASVTDAHSPADRQTTGSPMMATEVFASKSTNTSTAEDPANYTENYEWFKLFQEMHIPSDHDSEGAAPLDPGISVAHASDNAGPAAIAGRDSGLSVAVLHSSSRPMAVDIETKIFPSQPLTHEPSIGDFAPRRTAPLPRRKQLSDRVMPVQRLMGTHGAQPVGSSKLSMQSAPTVRPHSSRPNAGKPMVIDPIPIEIASSDEDDNPNISASTARPTVINHVFTVRPREPLPTAARDINLRGLFAAYPMSHVHQQQAQAEADPPLPMRSDVYRPLFHITEDDIQAFEEYISARYCYNNLEDFIRIVLAHGHTRATALEVAHHRLCGLLAQQRDLHLIRARLLSHLCERRTEQSSQSSPAPPRSDS